MQLMDAVQFPSPASVEEYLRSRPRWIRWRQWANGRRYRVGQFSDRARPLVIAAYSFRDTARARQLAPAVEQDWAAIPNRCREAYDEILFKVPGLIIVQLRRKNVCGCLGHRHLIVKEAPFAESHDAFGGVRVGEMDIAFERVETWQGRIKPVLFGIKPTHAGYFLIREKNQELIRACILHKRGLKFNF